MQTPNQFTFEDQFVFSQGESSNSDVERILLLELPGAAHAYEAHSANDRNGTDWWVECMNGNHLSVDVKVRREDWAAKPSPSDDLALETFSVVEKQIPGWTRDVKKRTDYILWLWTDTGRWCLIPFPMLCRVFQVNWQDWRKTFKTAKQFTRSGSGGWHSECVFVPRKTLWAELYKHFSGVPRSAEVLAHA